MFGLVHCNASILAQKNTDSNLYLVRVLVKHWLWPIITFFGVAGNILAIIVLTKRRMIMSSTNNYLVALAIVDIAYLILTLIINTLQNPCFTNSSLSAVVSTICRPIADFSSNSSVWLTVTFTVERWVAITYPLQSRRWCTIERARKIIWSVMGASLICTLPSTFERKLVRITVRKNMTDRMISNTYLKVQLTSLGESLHYQKIYFNFVTFAIVWIPLLLLLIFNTVLIHYVHQSKQNKEPNFQGIELRRHSRNNQNEQRKTTIMLIAVVIVFTVCQIPQAVSLTLQSFFPVLARTSQVLIYNNFANCLVALNASINFYLYCCFSDRFRSTFSSSFTFLSKYCAEYMQPKWQITVPMSSHLHSCSVDATSYMNQSSYSLPGNQVATRVSSTSIDNSFRYSHHLTPQQPHLTELGEQSWLTRFSFLSSKLTSGMSNNQLKPTYFSQSTESCPNSPTTSLIKSPLFLNRQTPSTIAERKFKRSIGEETTKAKAVSISENICSTSFLYHQPSVDERISKQAKFHSFRSLAVPSHPRNEQIWVRRHKSSSTIEQLFNRKNSFDWNEIMDVTV